MNVEILHGDCRETLKTLPDASVNCCVTSPPYFGLRDYGHDGQIGLEESPDAFVQQMVGVFREVRRVLRDDGTLWLNLGDSYNAHPGQRKTTDSVGDKQASNAGSNTAPSRHVAYLKPKDLIGIPWRVAFALQADGWYLRQDIIWHKPNPMPESVTDRCTKAHEYIFLLSKSARYFYDAEAICEPSEGVSGGPFSQKTHEGRRSAMAGGAEIGRPEDKGTRNRRSVWSVVTKPYKAAHFATFPPDLIRPCILAGCPTGGTVLDPFGGSGTTGQVAMEEGRNAILCELNADYVGLIGKRIGGVTPSLFGRAA
jgi:DNA modification methylase